MEDGRRVTWSEVRDAGEGQSEVYFLIAEQTQAGWCFYERSTWEVRWHSVLPSEALLTRANSEAGGRLSQ